MFLTVEFSLILSTKKTIFSHVQDNDHTLLAGLPTSVSYDEENDFIDSYNSNVETV